MGSGTYDDDEGLRTRAIHHVQRVEPFAYRGSLSADEVRAGKWKADRLPEPSSPGVHPLLDAKGKIRECVNRTPVVVALDVTRSRGQDSRVVYDNLPHLVRDLRRGNLVDDVAISFAAVGDVSAGDKAPIQVGQFEADNRLDEALRQVWIEEGGGGGGQESYELLAAYYARFSHLHCLLERRKGFFFFLGDEAPYEQVSALQVKHVLGHNVPRDIPTDEIFRELQEKYHVFFLCPQRTRAQRKADIDAEMKQRVLGKGGRYDNVDIRLSLLWNDHNDLDISIVPPSGERIYHGRKRSACGGWLDVDMNVRGETSRPVENIQWAKGLAQPGRYRVYVQNYRYHETDRRPIPFRAELEVQGRVEQISRVISEKGETGSASELLLWEFNYDPQRQALTNEAADANYDDNVILERWKDLLPVSHILRVLDPASLTDVIGGVMAVAAGLEPEEYVAQLGKRCTKPRQVIDVLRPLWNAWGDNP